MRQYRIGTPMEVYIYQIRAKQRLSVPLSAIRVATENEIRRSAYVYFQFFSLVLLLPPRYLG